MNKKISTLIIALLILCGVCLTGCKMLDSATFRETETAVTNTNGTPLTTSDGRQIYEANYEPSPLVQTVTAMIKAAPSPFNWIGYGLAGIVYGVGAFRRKRYVKNTDGTITELQEANDTLTKALNALAVARDQLWDTLDTVEGGDKVIAWFDNFAKNNAVSSSQKVLQFITDTLAKTTTPDKNLTGLLTTLQSIGSDGTASAAATTTTSETK